MLILHVITVILTNNTQINVFLPLKITRPKYPTKIKHRQNEFSCRLLKLINFIQ